MSLFDSDLRFKEIQEIIDNLDINTLSPVEALLLNVDEVVTVVKKPVYIPTF